MRRETAQGDSPTPQISLSCPPRIFLELNRDRFNLSFAAQLVIMSSRKTATRRATTKKRAQRATSNVFAMFDQAQIAEFKVRKILASVWLK